MSGSSSTCGARRRDGDVCLQRAGWGTDRVGYGTCKLHGGSTRNGNVRAAKLREADHVRDVGVVMGLPVEVDPLEALMQCLYIAAGEVEYCGARLARLSTEEELALGVPSSEARFWIAARSESVDRLARLAKMAIDAGVSERQIASAERLGQLIGELVRGVLGDLDLSEDQQAAAPGLVRRHLKLTSPDRS
jgi:hypothetical protein